MRADHELNRASWDQLAAIHGQDSYYDADALCAGESSLIAEEEAALSEALGSELAGKRILHLQCHLGFDAITFARRGACVTGVDFSTVALGKARALAARCGVTIDWICADVLELPRSLHESFDLVWATMGVLCWIADVSAWMRATAAVLAPGGKLVLIDGAPGAPTCGPGEPGQDRFAPVRRVLARGCDYATPAHTGPQVQFQHARGAILDAAGSAGLRVSRLEEHTSISSHLCISGLSRGTDGRFRRVGSQEPILFTLVAERDARSNRTDAPACAREPYTAQGTPVHGTTLLHIAVYFDEPEIAEWLLSRGMDPDAPAAIDADGFGGYTALYSTVVSHHNFWVNYGKGQPDDARFTRLLLDRGADPNARASIRARLEEGHGGGPLREYRGLTPLAWGEQYHAKIFVSRESLRLIEAMGGGR